MLKAPLPIYSLYNIPHFNVHSGEKDHVKYKDELKPFTMNYIFDNPGANKRRKIVGRGPASGRGKTSTRGHKGTWARSGGGVPAYFEGGQTRLARRLPKFGFTRRNRKRYEYVNMEKIIDFVRKGRLDPSKTITIRDLFMAKVVPKCKYGIKILARGAHELNYPLHLEVSDASEEAIKAIKDNGGSVTCIYRTRLKLKEHIKPHKFPVPLADPLPAYKQVKKLDAIKQRGAEVVFPEPDWYKEAAEEARLAKERYSKDDFEFPVKRYEGMGKDTIRKRKPKLIRNINLGIQQ
mmetsp:Transcript_40449/g.35902  ORF Transcript_40449/g.35902 Transcript_40449/m.35902 type:complete len:292 (+) Transcript_40449:90-965(+)